MKVCAADDDTTPCKTLNAMVTNVNPTAVIDTTNTVTVNGVPTVIAHAGAKVDFKVRITNPGSDDLAVTWDWGDGSTPTATSYLVNPPNTNPPKSPSDPTPRHKPDVGPRLYSGLRVHQCPADRR